MDMNQLIPIIVAAIIGAIAKELISWLITTIKGFSVLASIKENIRLFFNKENRAIISDLFFLTLNILILINFTQDPTPPTRSTVVLAIALVIGILIFAISLLFNLAKLKIRRSKVGA